MKATRITARTKQSKKAKPNQNITCHCTERQGSKDKRAESGESEAIKRRNDEGKVGVSGIEEDFMAGKRISSRGEYEGSEIYCMYRWFKWSEGDKSRGKENGQGKKVVHEKG